MPAPSTVSVLPIRRRNPNRDPWPDQVVNLVADGHFDPETVDPDAEEYFRLMESDEYFRRLEELIIYEGFSPRARIAA